MKRLEKFSCLVALIGGKLHKCKILPDGSPDFSAGSFNWIKVDSKVGQDFLEAANSVLGTNFVTEDFIDKSNSEEHTDKLEL